MMASYLLPLALTAKPIEGLVSPSRSCAKKTQTSLEKSRVENQDAC